MASTSGYPDATTTGVPAGVTLTPSGGIVINTPGAVIEGLDIKGPVVINAPNVTLKNCKIASGDYAVVLVKPGITGAVIQNCDIDNLGAGGQGIAGQGTFVANNIHGCADGIDVRGSDTIIKDNFIHDMRGTSASHYDGIQADGGFSNLQIIHNTVINEKGQTSALMLDNYWGPIDNVKIDNNLLVGGGYTVYINEVASGQPGGGPVTNVSFTNNHLGKGYYGELDLRTQLGNQPYIAGNVSDGYTLASQLQLTGQPSGDGTTLPPLVAPTIDSYSQDSGTQGDGITNDSTLSLTGKAAAGAVVSVFDGATKVGSATANSSGTWTYTTPTLNDGNHSLTAKVSDSAGKTVSSSALSVKVDTVAPTAPTLTATKSTTDAADYALKGTAEANSKVDVFDGATKIGAATANSTGAWNYNANDLATGTHSFTAKATDAAGNTGAASAKVDVNVGSTTPPPTPEPSTGFPDATTAGVPAGITLKASGALVINTPGTVIDGLDIKGSVIINADNVTIKNSKIASSDFNVVLVKPGITGAVIQNCEIDNLGAGGQGIAGQGKFIANNIHDAADGIDVRGSNTLIQDNFIHNLSGTSNSHYDGIQADGNFSNLQIIHNTIVNEHNQTSALMLDNYWGPIDNVKIDNNLLVGGGFTVYINEVANGQPGGGPVTNVSFTNNHIGKGYWGEMDIRSELGHEPYMSGNVSDGHTLADQLQYTGQPSGDGTTLPPVDAPSIDGYSQDSGTQGDGVTNDSTLTLTGKAGAGAVVNVFDGATKIGTATANSTGAWTYTTAVLKDGSHSLVAKVTDSGGKIAASAALAVVIDTVAPVTPTLAATKSATDAHDYALAGAAEANSSVDIFDGANKIGTVKAGTGDWSFNANDLTDGAHSFTAKAVDVAGNTSAASTKVDVTIAPAPQEPAPGTASVEFSDMIKNSDNTVTFKGTADAGSSVKIFEAGVSEALGTVKADANGTWSFTTTSPVSDRVVNDYTAKVVDAAGNVTDTSGHAFIGSSGKDTIVSSSDDDLMVGAGQSDTFVFKPDFGNDVIKDFRPTGGQHDVIQFSKSVFSNFADVLAHAKQDGVDVVISTDAGDTLKLKDTKMAHLDKGDFTFA